MAQEKSVKDLQSRMSELSTKAVEIDRVVEKLTDTDDREGDIERLEDEYQKLFTETLKLYG